MAAFWKRKKFLQLALPVLVAVVVGGGLLAGVQLSQMNQDTRSQADGVDNCCYLGWTCNTDAEWQAGWYAYQNGQCGGGGGGTPDTGGSGSDGYSDWNQTSCTNWCSSNKGGTVGGRRTSGRHDGNIRDCECYCTSGSWDASYSTCGGGTSSGGGGGGSSDGLYSPNNKSAGDNCVGGKTLPQEGGCDGDAPLQCIVCPGGTVKASQNVCSLFQTSEQVAQDCGGYTTGNTTEVPSDVGNTSLTCVSGSESNCGGNKVGSQCIATGNSTGYCHEVSDASNTSTGTTACTCVQVDTNAVPISGGSPAECTTGWTLYQCDRVDTGSGCEDNYIATYTQAQYDQVRIQLDGTPACTTRQADCNNRASDGSLIYMSRINNPGGCNTGGTGGDTGTGDDTGDTGTGGGGGSQTSPTPTATTSTPPQSFACGAINASIEAPKIGDTVSFTCSASGVTQLVTNYKFRYKVNTEGFQDIGISTDAKSQSVGIVINKPGLYQVQCQACSDTQCSPWETL